MISGRVQTSHHSSMHVAQSGLRRPDATSSQALLPSAALGENLPSEAEAGTSPAHCSQPGLCYDFFPLLCQAVVGRMGLGIRPAVDFNPVMAFLSM